MEDQDQRVSQVPIKTKIRGSHELLAKVGQDTRNKAKVGQDTRIKLGPAWRSLIKIMEESTKLDAAGRHEEN